ncbi:MAG: GNAT family N-acetyltransferase, partial [Candidatus Peribacteraceae bacterium]|nr:GNAT family N-acetyltransferase [Candidatus Peribacteraceae bacterium]
ERIEDKDPVAFVGYLDEKPVGFLIAYDKYGDGSWYCWRAGVIPNYRRNGVNSKMMDTFEQVAKQKEYSMVKVVTRNNRREMLSYLVKNNWCFVEMFPKEIVEDGRMLLLKKI